MLTGPYDPSLWSASIPALKGSTRNVWGFCDWFWVKRTHGISWMSMQEWTPSPKSSSDRTHHLKGQRWFWAPWGLSFFPQDFHHFLFMKWFPGNRNMVSYGNDLWCFGWEWQKGWNVGCFCWPVLKISSLIQKGKVLYLSHTKIYM